ncbi:hypothetical protein T4D_1155 [Trichinella pseudospiralis]|uniref:Uncharacterized protein n=1 Tax=Trichinella pseudospiralis TaxID=6337 RepID=A0A0V1FQN7_TRIPS|nr:hypothetical protein T4D_1155 [Trichinella pseudospiralis]
MLLQHSFTLTYLPIVTLKRGGISHEIIWQKMNTFSSTDFAMENYFLSDMPCFGLIGLVGLLLKVHFCKINERYEKTPRALFV